MPSSVHHSRRKSGHGSTSASSMTDIRKSSAKEPHRSSRTSGSSSKKSTSKEQPTSSSHKSGRSPREREREYVEYDYDDYEEDGRDTFPQFCMTCEKQFNSIDDRCLYCSEECRQFDESSFHEPSSRSTVAGNGYRQPLFTTGYYNSGDHEPKDIIPRASPSRPTSTYFASSTVTPGDATAAISALRSLTIRPASPSSPSGGVGSSLWPFNRSAAAGSEATYSRGSHGAFPSTYDGAYGKRGHTGSGSGGYGYGGHYSSSGMDRPLPSRRPGGYARPKSIELVTPMVSR